MRTLSAALFLACSWFWCIGGFFPMLLVTDFGDAMFPFFFVFNVMGAATFGLIWTDCQRLAFLTRHSGSAQLFSIVVAGYHAVFVTWIASLSGAAWVPAFYLLATAGFWCLRKSLFPMSIGLFALTLGVFGVTLSESFQLISPHPATEGLVHGILPLALGFLLAPYFDLTFHRAFAESPHPKVSFVLGFLLAFGVLLLGVYFSIGFLEALVSTSAPVSTAYWVFVGLLVLQFGFTTAAHLSELSRIQPALPRARTGLALGVVAALVALHATIALVWPDGRVPLGLLVYRSFIFIIGGLFPLLILFQWDRRYVLVAGGIVMIPCYSLGFLIGGAFAPLLSLAMTGLVGMSIVRWWGRPGEEAGA